MRFILTAGVILLVITLLSGCGRPERYSGSMLASTPPPCTQSPAAVLSDGTWLPPRCR